MLKAGALFYSIAIALIIALVSSSLIMFAYFNLMQVNTYLRIEKVERNAASGLNILLTEQGIIAEGEGKIIDLFETGEDSVFLEKKFWGIFEIGKSIAFSGDKRSARIALIGTLFNDNQTSLYLADLDKPLSLCGNTLIRGTAYLPKAGVKRAYIEGQSFSGDKLIDGIIKDSDRNLPAIRKELLEQLSKQTVGSDSLSLEELLSRDSIVNSFANPTIYLNSTLPLVLDNKFYKGNIVISSSKSIHIGSGVGLQDVILKAPKIEIAEKFTGSLQAIASDSLIVSKNCKLNYPSALGLISKEVPTGVPLISVGEETEISGAVFISQKNKTDERKLARMVIEKKVKVIGQVYSDGLLDLKGTVYGTVMCNRFMLTTPSSVYENHLLNVVIDNTKLSKNYTGISLTAGGSSSKKISKWLY